MTRRLLALLVPLVALPLAGCTTFSDNDAAARVDDAELTDETLEELVPLIGDPQGGSQVGQTASGDAVRNTLSFWIRAQIIEQVLGEEGIEPTDEQLDEATQQAAGSVAGFTELSAGSQDLIVGFLASSAALEGIEATSSEEVAEFYDRGMDDSGIACVSHILVETEDEANEVLDELGAGADFPTLAQQRSIDPGSATQGGVLACTPTSQFRTTYVPEFVAAAADAEIGVPTGPVSSEFGYHVIRVRTADEAMGELADYFASSEFSVARRSADTDIYVDPRYGTLDPLGVVVPLG